MDATWRLLVTEPLDGATNMAVDEALLRARIGDSGPPTVRFYGWRPATVSLGYAQLLDEAVDRRRCDALGIGLARRPTGGSAILHEPPDGEVTYSVVAREGDFAGADDVLETYRVLGEGLAAGLERLGVNAQLTPLARGRRAETASAAFCFRRAGAFELAVGGRKLVGSAQRRQRRAFLQHGSVLLTADPARLRAVFPREPDPTSSLTTLAEILGRSPAFDAVTTALGAGLADALGVCLVPGDLTEDEWATVDALVRGKYGTDAWTTLGVLPEGIGAPGMPAGAIS
jgi:lipoyl(octanoyl) transferase